MRTLIFLIVLFFSASAQADMVVQSFTGDCIVNGQGAAPATSCTVGSGDNWVNEGTESDFINIVVDDGQYVHNTSTIQICQVDVFMYNDGSCANVQLRIQDGTRGGSTLGSSNVITSPTHDDWNTFTFSDVEVTGDFFIGWAAAEGTADCYWTETTANTYFGETSNNAYEYGGFSSEDMRARIYYQQ